jgi:hypothetical protein
MPVWRALRFVVVATVVDGDRLLVSGRCREEPLAVGDAFRRLRPPASGGGEDRPCAFEIARILQRGCYVTWIDGNRDSEAELELSGDLALAAEIGPGSELCGESSSYLPPFAVLGRGEPRLVVP